MTSRASDPFPPLANSDFSGHGFLLFRWLVFTNSVSRTPSRPTGCQIKYGGYQFADCKYVHFSVHRYEKNPGFSAVDVRTRKKPEKPPPPYLILHSVCTLSLFQRSRFQRGQINDPGKIAVRKGGKGRNEIGMKAQLVQDQLFTSPASLSVP